MQGTDVELDQLTRPVKHAFREEVNLFIHVHMRGYDKNGDGVQMHAAYYDKYGAPMNKERSWLQGYRAIEDEIVKHANRSETEGFDFPIPAAVAGASHLYITHHADNPWDWTGFVPRQSRWVYHDKFFQNRHFMNLRGNEVQNNLWDYDPHDEEDGSIEWDKKYVQIQPVDAYRGGYWFYNKAWGRYLHIIGLKSVNPNPDPTTKLPAQRRYNYIVHPLAYRGSESSLPDNSVDAMQWCIINANNGSENTVPTEINKTTVLLDTERKALPVERAFDPTTPLRRWGDKCHGVEVYNDFTYYYSASPLDEGKDDPWKGGNGFLHDKEGTPNNYVHWFDTYPLEFGEFLVETSLRYGSYMQILSANDAMYVRETVVVDRNAGTVATKSTRSEPRQHLTSKLKTDHNRQMTELRSLRKDLVSYEGGEEEAVEYKQKNDNLHFLGSMPYEQKTVFGYTALIDPELKLKKTVYGSHDYIQQVANLDEGEFQMIQYMTEGRFFGHTGIYDIFNYRDDDDNFQQYYPIQIGDTKQKPDCSVDSFPDTDTSTEGLAFIMPKAQKVKGVKKQRIAEHIVWQYTVEVYDESKSKPVITCHRGYFKLHEDYRTKVQLKNSKIPASKITWIRIQAYDVRNPHRRAWFQPIKGPKFSSFASKKNDDPELTNKIWNMSKAVKGDEKSPKEMFNIYEQNDEFIPGCASASSLHFDLGTVDEKEEHNLCVYNLQVAANKRQRVDKSHTQFASIYVPPSYRQNVCGVLQLSTKYPTKLDLKKSWDATTVKKDDYGKAWAYIYMVTKSGELK
ncbi:uncharacterized protein [Clytia hemisphaerica]|uniref:Uncharacterized protein n=1 Tax=Clytia hemisphaerica TaxID=252671 RepID=A0A7M5X1B8_9CNID